VWRRVYVYMCMYGTCLCAAGAVLYTLWGRTPGLRGVWKHHAVRPLLVLDHASPRGCRMARPTHVFCCACGLALLPHGHYTMGYACGLALLPHGHYTMGYARGLALLPHGHYTMGYARGLALLPHGHYTMGYARGLALLPSDHATVCHTTGL
jgi:hypothetical protein